MRRRIPSYHRRVRLGGEDKVPVVAIIVVVIVFVVLFVLVSVFNGPQLYEPGDAAQSVSNVPGP